MIAREVAAKYGGKPMESSGNFSKYKFPDLESSTNFINQLQKLFRHVGYAHNREEFIVVF